MRMLLALCFLLFSISCWGVLTPCAAAASDNKSRHLPTDKILEYSLSRLQESMQKTKQKNDRLAFENNALRKSIQDLEQMRRVLTAKKNELSGMPPSFDFRRDQRELPSIRNREQKTQELITVFEQNIMVLKEEIGILEDSLNGKNLDSEEQVLFKKKKESEKNLFRAEKELKSLEQKNKKPLKLIEILTKKQNDLAYEMRTMENRFNRF